MLYYMINGPGAAVNSHTLMSIRVWLYTVGPVPINHVIEVKVLADWVGLLLPSDLLTIN